ncbi:hypothetical protein PMN63_16850, partial [Blautia wexlerae]|nr:hypothetical protein [Blautia wexlerae]
MTKIKNTKKGMAKKTLSMSLVVAMLATSNVPVWAAEFSDGPETPVATEAPATEAFTADEEAAAPVADDTTDVAVAEVSNRNEYSMTLTPMQYDGKDITGNAVVWDNKNLTTSVTVTDNGIIDPSTVDLKADWKIDGVVAGSPASLTAGQPKNCQKNIKSWMVGKKVALYVYAQNKTTGEIVWSDTSDEITVNAKNTADIVEATASNVVYNGSIQNPENTITPTAKVSGAALPQELNDISDYNLGYDENTDFVNVTGKKITVTLTPKSPAYKGSITATYEIIAKSLNTKSMIADEMVATLKNTSFKFDGSTNGDVKIKKEDITLVDKATKTIDLSDYLKVDKNGYVNVTRSGEIELATPENGNKNYTIDTTATDAKIQSTNVPEVVARDLSTVAVTIDPIKATGSKAAPAQGNYHFYDKDTKKPLDDLYGYVDIDIPNNAVSKGTYTVTITPKATTSSNKLTGNTTAELAIFTSDIKQAVFKLNGTPKEDNNNRIPDSTVKKYYTGEPVTFTTDEIGVPTIGNTPLNATDYEITYANNTNAGTANMFLIGKDSYANSIKNYTFTINKTPVSDVTASKYVEKINGAKPEDYKAAMGVVVTAKVPNTNKVLTLTEGKDYTVDYDWVDATKSSVKATVKVKSNSNFTFKSGTTEMIATSKISNATLKSEYIKLKETSFTYNGQAVKPDFDVVIGGHTIDPANYTTKYTNNVNAGTATLTITAVSGKDYEGTASITYTIQSADAAKLNGVIGTQHYKGYTLEIPADKIDLTLNGDKIDVESNFTLTYGENKEVGEGTVTLTPKNKNFTGTKTLTFQISGEMLDPSKATFKFVDGDGFPVSSPSFNYDGTEHTYAKTILSYDGKALKEGRDYEIKYVDNVYGKKGLNGQYAAVLAVAKGKFGGNLTTANTTEGIDVKDGIYTDAAGNKITNVFKMQLIKINQEEITDKCVSVSNGTYAAGLPVKPSVKIVVKGRTLVEGTDYDLDVSVNKDVINATEKQTLLVTVKPKNGYKKQNNTLVNLSWGIDKFDLTNADVTVNGDKVTVKCGKVEVAADEYTVTKDAAANKVTVTATKGNKNYTGSKTVSAVVTDPTEKPGAPMISSVKVVGNKATAILSGDTEGAAGYDYVISTDRDCITNKNYDSISKNQVQTSTTFKYVQQGTYYAYCHAWKRDANGKKVFSDWSSAYPFVVSAITPDAPVITNVTVSGST